MDGMPELSPLQALAVGTAYIVMADKKALPEERASLVSLLGKYEFDKFLMSIEATLSPAQIISILSNMYETMIVDGNVVSREKEMVEEFFRFFDIDRRVVNTIREILMVKNDTTLFLRTDHPNNSRDFRFGFLDRMDLDA
jgi:hypothetical protein